LGSWQQPSLLHLDGQVICVKQVPSACRFECKLCVIQGGNDIRDCGLLVDIDAEDLSLLVDTVGRLVLRSYKDSLAGNMNKTVFRLDDAMLLRYLHGYWEVVRCFGWEVDTDGFLDEWGNQERCGRFQQHVTENRIGVYGPMSIQEMNYGESGN
jgi:hypothetical protein